VISPSLRQLNKLLSEDCFSQVDIRCQVACKYVASMCSPYNSPKKIARVAWEVAALTSFPNRSPAHNVISILVGERFAIV
jgi:hypothetical protein